MSGFHIHVDAITLTEKFEEYLIKELGFWRSDFAGHPEGVEHFEPPHHLTKKVATSFEFRAMFDGLLSHVEDHLPMVGYLEGEYIALDKDLEEHQYDASVKPPFKIETGSLPPASFRESEIHIVLNRELSDERLLQSLADMGFFTAYLPKSYGLAQIFTAQGSKETIQEILPPLIEYLEKAGGAVNCSIMEERVAGWWLSASSVRMPPVIAAIHWN
ncbi:MAG TPA: hypothetical protein VGO91_13685 [Pyrinomonadaceae bacterium]|nr:hypothetical protein [Pyrinomonadaceae bacterium]